MKGLCGNICVVLGSSLTTEATKFCGCLNNEMRSKTVNEKFRFEVDSWEKLGFFIWKHIC